MACSSARDVCAHLVGCMQYRKRRQLRAHAQTAAESAETAGAPALHSALIVATSAITIAGAGGLPAARLDSRAQTPDLVPPCTAARHDMLNAHSSGVGEHGGAMVACLAHWLAASHHAKIYSADQLRSVSLGGFNRSCSLLQSTRVRPENDCASDNSRNRPNQDCGIEPDHSENCGQDQRSPGSNASL